MQSVSAKPPSSYPWLVRQLFRMQRRSVSGWTSAMMLLVMPAMQIAARRSGTTAVR
jgi:hypothetical protein